MGLSAGQRVQRPQWMVVSWAKTKTLTLGAYLGYVTRQGGIVGCLTLGAYLGWMVVSWAVLHSEHT
jgi:hypothetical protein